MEYKKSRDTLRSRVGTGPRVNQEKFTHYYQHLIHLLSEQLLFFAMCDGEETADTV